MSNTKAFYYILCTLSAFLLIKCTTIKKTPYQKLKTISFELPYVPNTWGYFYEKDSLYFYTYNYPTYKNIDILNQNGKVVYSIDLRKLKLFTDRINVDIHALDSIYIVSKEPSNLFLLNKKGVVCKKISIDSLFYHKTTYTQKRVKHFQIFSYGNMIEKDDFMSTIYVQDTSYKPPGSLYERDLYNNEYEYKMPKLLYVKNVLGNSSIVLHDTGWVTKVIKEKDEDFMVFPLFFFLKDKIVFCTSYDRHIYFVNPKDLGFERKIPIYSEYTELEYKKPKFIKDSVEALKNLYSGFRISYKPAIINVQYINNQYFVLTRHEVALPKNEEIIPPDPYEARYSVIIYDKQWKKQKEILLPEKEKFVAFLPNKQFITQSKTKNPRQVTLNFYQFAE